jgi:hypothetical protein
MHRIFLIVLFTSVVLLAADTSLASKLKSQHLTVAKQSLKKHSELIELISPISPISQKMSVQTYREDPLFTDIIDLEMEGMQWLENSRIFESMVIDETGSFAIVPTIHPLEFAVYKYWLSLRSDRDVLKKQRDFEQSRLVTQLIRDYMVNIDIDAELTSMKHFNYDAIMAYRHEMLS